MALSHTVGKRSQISDCVLPHSLLAFCLGKYSLLFELCSAHVHSIFMCALLNYYIYCFFLTYGCFLIYSFVKTLLTPLLSELCVC